MKNNKSVTKKKNETADTKSKKTNVKTKIILGIVVLLAIVLCIGLLANSQNVNKLINEEPEIARSMTYNQVQPGEENIER